MQSIKSALVCGFAVMGISTAAHAGLIAHYTFDGHLNDSVGNNHATADGTVNFVAGVAGQAMSVDALSYAVSQNNVGISGNQARTLSFWFNAAELQNQAPVSFGEKLNTAKTLFEVLLGGESNDYKLIGHFWGTGGDTIGIADGSYTPGTWTHIALVYDGSVVKLYQDGQQVGSDYAVELNTVDDKLFLGGGNLDNPFGANYVGAIDDVQLYNNALNAEQINFLYSNPGEAVPEPASLALIGLGGLLLVRRRG